MKDKRTGGFLDGERLASQTRLIKIHGATFAQQTISGSDITNLEKHKVTGHQFTSTNLLPCTITLHVAIEGEKKKK